MVERGGGWSGEEGEDGMVGRGGGWGGGEGRRIEW